jgi:uncharacterized protein (DUF362 family)/Pyruvate/2-oxoacid:ferredoxin oxidoreductase delta subunit
LDNRVYAVRCPDYLQVDGKVLELLSMMGGVGLFANPGERVALKVNLLSAARPEQAVTTHPAVVAAIAALVKQEGAKPFIIDSPGSGYRYNKKMMDKTYRLTGMYQAAEKAGVEVNLECSYREVSFPQGRMIKRFEIITPVLEADAVINICKLKTHVFTFMTGAVKNHFGVIPGLAKPGYHAKLNDTKRFAAMLLDLTELISSRLFIMDAVTAMEGDGPSAGAPRPVGLILASTNPVALDAVGGEIIGLDWAENPVLVEAANRHLKPNRIEDIQLIGIGAEELRVPNFQMPSTYYGGSGFGHLSRVHHFLVPLFKSAMSVKPRVIRKKCSVCGSCVTACPVKAITLNEKKYAVIDDDLCIRCYCCHEMCEEKAIELHHGLLYRFINPA